jgi:hypothetical protein
MKTSIVYGEYHTLRACLPGESTDCKGRIYRNVPCNPNPC